MTVLYRVTPAALPPRLSIRWSRFWMRYAWARGVGWVSRRLAEMTAPPHLDRVSLAYMNERGYISTRADVKHKELWFGKNVYIGDRATVHQCKDGGKVTLNDKVSVHRDVIVETGNGGAVTLGRQSSVHPWSQLRAHVSPIEIGEGVMIAANCAFYSYDHSTALGTPTRRQPLCSRGPIVIGDEAWFGTGCIVLGGVNVGEGAVIGAGSVVTKDIPAYAIAVGNPARVVKMRQ